MNAVTVGILYPAAAGTQYRHKYPTSVISSTLVHSMSVTKVVGHEFTATFVCEANGPLPPGLALNCCMQGTHTNLKSHIATYGPKFRALNTRIINPTYLIGSERVKITRELPARWPSTFCRGTEFGPVFMYRKPFVYTPRAKWGLCVGRLPAQSRSRH